MADVPNTTNQGVQTGVDAGTDHTPGSLDPDSSVAQIPRMASGGVGAGDVARARGDEPVLGARSADARFEAGDPAGGTGGEGAGLQAGPLATPLPDAGADEDGRPVMAQPVQQQQAQVAAGPGAGASTGTSSGTPRAAEGGPQETTIEGPGYPSEDMDDADDMDPDEDEGLLSGDEDDEGDEFADIADVDDDVQALAPPELGDAPIEEEIGDTSILGAGHTDKAAWNRERIAAMQDEEEHAETDTFGSQAVLGHGETPDVLTADLALLPGSGGSRTPGSSEDMGYGGGAPSEDADPDVPGLETGDGIMDDLTEDTNAEVQEDLEDAVGGMDDPAPGDAGGAPGRQARADDPSIRAKLGPSSPGTGQGGIGELAARHTGRDPEHGRVALSEEVGAFRDDSAVLRGPQPFLPEHRNFLEGELDDNIPLEERLLDGGGEDPSFYLGEVGFAEDLEMEQLNATTDDISNAFEDQRFANDAGDGNEERDWRRK
jgi:hypothetical protein